MEVCLTHFYTFSTVMYYILSGENDDLGHSSSCQSTWRTVASSRAGIRTMFHALPPQHYVGDICIYVYVCLYIYTYTYI